MFFKKTPKERFIAQERKILENRSKRDLRIASYAATLNECAFTLETAVAVQRNQAIERRKKRLSDDMQQMYIHDAVVCLLAIEEAQLEINALGMIQELQQAEKALQKVLGKMYSVNHYLSLTGKEVKSKLGMEFDDTVEPVTFSERADLVDKAFVERIIAGATIEECLNNVNGTDASKESISSLFADDPSVTEDISAMKKRLEDEMNDF